MLSLLLEENLNKGYRTSLPCHLLSSHNPCLYHPGLLPHSAHLSPATLPLPLRRRLFQRCHLGQSCPPY